MEGWSNAASDIKMEVQGEDHYRSGINVIRWQSKSKVSLLNRLAAIQQNRSIKCD